MIASDCTFVTLNTRHDARVSDYERTLVHGWNLGVVCSYGQVRESLQVAEVKKVSERRSIESRTLLRVCEYIATYI